VSSHACQRASALATKGAIAEGYQLLQQAAAGGDGYAAALLADWRLAGQFIRRDLGEARRLYGLAWQLGITGAAAPHIALLASGAGGCGRDWQAAMQRLRQVSMADAPAAMQLSLLAAMPLSDEGRPTQSFTREFLAGEPQIEQFPGFLTSAECEYLCRIAVPALSPALVVDPRTGAMRPDPVRIARTAAFPFIAEDPVLHAINQRIAAATGTLWEQGEPAQVIAYRAGEEYRLHSDALPGDTNQRVITFLVALNDSYEGGATSFPAIGLNWRGRTGDALMFRNVGADGSSDPAARHAGNPIRKGTKFILSRWIRARPLDLAGPPGRPF